MSLEEEVLRRIRPSTEERARLIDVYGKVRRVAEDHLSQLGLKAKISLQGSVAKDTWLSGDVDLDVFILFPKRLGRTWVKEHAMEVLTGIAERGGWFFQARYAEHPYITMHVDGIRVDLVPALKLESPLEAETAVDRTPFHTRYVVSRLDGEGKDQVRLLKKFMKGIGVYGAEVRIGGFSGYLAELLVMRYGGFREVLKEASAWRRPVHIMVEETDVTWELWDAPMIVPDPVDPRRNVAAAVTARKLGEFVVASRLYLDKPSFEFFYGPSGRPAPLGELVVVSVEGVPRLPPDVLWGELGRVARRLRGVLKSRGFRVSDVMIWSDGEGRASWCVELESSEQPRMELVVGPAFEDRGASMRFVEAYRRRRIPVWIDWDGRLRALRPRRHRSAVEVLSLLASEYLTAPHLRGLRPMVRAAGKGDHVPCLRDSFLASYTGSG